MQVAHLIVGPTLLVAALSATATPAPPTSVSVAGNTTTLIDLGNFAAGTYTLTGSGVIDLVGDGSFQIRPDGTPDAPVTAPNYADFNPAGSFVADGKHGPAGTVAKLGALIGTLNPLASLAPNPSASQQADWFLIGYGTTITLLGDSHIFASVNETYADNNSGAFQVSVSAVPEPAQWAMALAGLAIVGLWRRGRAGR
jgi:MYXO-CTERM domain-containing protein